ncbi:hypothetical protein P152DRAFT_46811 [Eremomyces bilateralis CBS 781.70]|uniref:Ankyrin n=1 Tax=Eremomyces bilateralis CBS 781.70 TaxID=1392243 RepID=A0A6G1G1Y8_9PEZI|nr:uncharacterized protein P152DRAFT_46811 [Eremomyces bilateralis CBS 781.70]KAF1812125.1 hypothetical protein P152DRAFT_46811 [Eremomyces bilateralis CBS 781.70]
MTAGGLEALAGPASILQVLDASGRIFAGLYKFLATIHRSSKLIPILRTKLDRLEKLLTDVRALAQTFQGSPLGIQPGARATFGRLNDELIACKVDLMSLEKFLGSVSSKSGPKLGKSKVALSKKLGYVLDEGEISRLSAEIDGHIGRVNGLLSTLGRTIDVEIHRRIEAAVDVAQDVKQSTAAELKELHKTIESIEERAAERERRQSEHMRGSLDALKDELQEVKEAVLEIPLRPNETLSQAPTRVNSMEPPDFAQDPDLVVKEPQPKLTADTSNSAAAANTATIDAAAFLHSFSALLLTMRRVLSNLDTNSIYYPRYLEKFEIPKKAQDMLLRTINRLFSRVSAAASESLESTDNSGTDAGMIAMRQRLPKQRLPQVQDIEPAPSKKTLARGFKQLKLNVSQSPELHGEWRLSTRDGVIYVLIEGIHSTLPWPLGTDDAGRISLCFVPNSGLHIPGIAIALMKWGHGRQYSESNDTVDCVDFDAVVSAFNVVRSDAPVLQAIADGDLKQVLGLLRRGEVGAMDRDREGMSLLAHAISAGNMDMCRLLLKMGADPQDVQKYEQLAFQTVGKWLEYV